MRHNDDLLKRMALGASAGLVGTFALQALRGASQKWMPQTMPPIRRDPGDYMVDRAKELVPYARRNRIPDAAEKAASMSLALGYGMTFGAVYAALRPEGGRTWLDGALLGLGTWAAGYLGWLPATGLMRPLWKQEAPQAIAPAVHHALYGMATVGTYDLLEQATR